MQARRAVRARAGRDAVILGQDIRYLARVHVADVERGDRRALMVKIAVERHTRNFFDARDKAAQQRHFMRVDGLNAGLLQKSSAAFSPAIPWPLSVPASSRVGICSGCSWR